MQTFQQPWLVRAAWITLWTCAASAQATPPASWQAVGPGTLASLRGGMDVQGLPVSFGMVREVSVNGQLVVRQSIQIPAIGNRLESNATLAAIKAPAGGDATLFQADFGPGAPGASLVQNSVDNQRIDSRTTIDAAVGSAGMLARLHFQAGLQDGLAQAAASR